MTNPIQKKETDKKVPFGLAGEVFGRIWAAWAAVVFLASLMVAVWPILFSYLIAEPTGVKIFKTTSKIWMSIFLYAIGCPLRVRGKENYEAGKNYVITSNHSSMMDVPLLTPFFPGANKTIAKKSMARIPVFGWVYARGSVLVDRNDNASRRLSFDRMKQVLAQQLCMAIYPEGTRNRTGKPLKPFYDGAFKLAIDCHKDIIPVVMFNTARALPPNKPFFMWPTPLEMHILPAIASEGKTVDQLKEEVFQCMWTRVQQGI